MNLTKNSHYVPQTYLKEWGIAGTKRKEIYEYRLYVPNKNINDWNKQSIRYTSSSKELYNCYSSDITSDALEKEFSKIESFYSRIKAVFSEKLDLTHDERIKLSKYIILQKYRTLDGYFYIRDLANSVIENLKFDTDSFSKVTTENSVAKNNNNGLIKFPIKFNNSFVSNKYIDIEMEILPGKQLWLNFLERAVNENYELIIDNKWEILRAPDDHYWFTSDKPVVVLEKVNGGYGYTNHIAKKDIAILFPITPKILLYSDDSNVLKFLTEADMNRYNKINQIICYNANIKIYSNKIVDNIHMIRQRLVDKEYYEYVEKLISNIYNDYHGIEKEFLKDI